MKKILACSNVYEFCENISIIDKKDIFYTTVSRFEDNEMCVKIDKFEELQNENIVVIQSLSNPVNDSLMELIFTLDILNSIGVKSIEILLTYAGYSRQDRIENINESFSFKIVANMLSKQYISRIYLVNVHAMQTMGFFGVPTVNIEVKDLICDLIKDKYKNPLLISPDVGNAKTIISLSNKMDMDYAIAIKYRPQANENKILSIIGTNVENKDCIIIDDIVDSAGTLCNVAERLAKNGANNIIAYITHPVLSSKSYNRIKNSYFTKLYIGDTINNKSKIDVIGGKIDTFSIADYVLNKVL